MPIVDAADRDQRRPKMRTLTLASIAVSVLLLGPSAAGAQGLDLTGSWAMQMTAVRSQTGAAVAPSCTFQGTANVAQTGNQLSGDISVDLTAGSNCPPTMSATLSGQVTGNQVNMGLVMGGGAFGEASFTGTQTSARPGAAATALGGSFTVTSGPFTGTGGTWSGTRQAPIATVPALGTRGLAILALLLLATATLLLRRRRRLG
jgi:hypothetical protein